MFTQIFIGLLGIGLGLLFAIKSEWLLHNVGRIASIERYLGTFGGSRLFYQLLGVLMIIFATLYMTGFLQKGIIGLFKRVFALE
ncbi:MAG: hypothetical protein HQ530_01195 [Parcubacteria group bacterium]|nr:hypothetical protein [Parcubacteria group bacterium]